MEYIDTNWFSKTTQYYEKVANFSNNLQVIRENKRIKLWNKNFQLIRGKIETSWFEKDDNGWLNISLNSFSTPPSRPNWCSKIQRCGSACFTRVETTYKGAVIQTFLEIWIKYFDNKAILSRKKCSLLKEQHQSWRYPYSLFSIINCSNIYIPGSRETAGKKLTLIPCCLLKSPNI